MGTYYIFLIILIAILSALIQGCTGFGFSIIAMSLLPQVMPYKYASMVTAISSIIMIMAITLKLRRFVNFKLMLYPLISSTFTSFVGVFALMSGSDMFMRRLLGLVLLLMSVFFIFYNDKIHISPTPINGFIVGAISGFFSGLFNLGGPPMVAYFLSATKDKMEYNATLQCYFVFNGAVILALHLLMGNFNSQIAQYSGIALVGVVIGTLIGYSIFRKISLQAIRKIVYGFTTIFGIYLLIVG